MKGGVHTPWRRNPKGRNYGIWETHTKWEVPSQRDTQTRRMTIHKEGIRRNWHTRHGIKCSATTRIPAPTHKRIKTRTSGWWREVEFPNIMSRRSDMNSPKLICSIVGWRSPHPYTRNTSRNKNGGWDVRHDKCKWVIEEKVTNLAYFPENPK